TPLPPSTGARFSHSIASSFDFTCHNQNPAISSLLSAKGPSITVRFFPSNRTRAPFELAWSPSPANITPAFTSSSLNFPISARISLLGKTPASDSLQRDRSEEHTSELQSRGHLVCRLLLEKKNSVS